MLRIVIKVDDAGMAANVGGDVHSSIKSFDFEFLELEEFLRSNGADKYCGWNVAGIELLRAQRAEVEGKSDGKDV